MIYLVSLILHVVSVILGLGPVLAVAVASRSATPDTVLIGRLARVIQWALVAMLLSGLAMMAEVNWIYVHTLWFRASGVVFLLLGGMSGRLAKAARNHELPLIQRLGIAMTVLVAIAAGLMEGKP